MIQTIVPVIHDLGDLQDAPAIIAGIGRVNTRTPRPAARILLTDAHGRVLLFRFTPEDDRPPFWCTPGGAVDPGESYEAAARRELIEETGLAHDPGRQVAQRQVDFVTIEGVEVTADERYFRVITETTEIRIDGHTDLERRVMQTHRWFSRDELATWPEPIFPGDLIALLDTTDDA